MGTPGRFLRVARATENANTAGIELYDYDSLAKKLALLGSSKLSDVDFLQIVAARNEP